MILYFDCCRLLIYVIPLIIVPVVRPGRDRRRGILPTFPESGRSIGIAWRMSIIRVVLSQRSECSYAAVATRIAGALEPSVRMTNERAGVAHQIAIRRDDFDVVSGCFQ